MCGQITCFPTRGHGKVDCSSRICQTYTLPVCIYVAQDLTIQAMCLFASFPTPPSQKEGKTKFPTLPPPPPKKTKQKNTKIVGREPWRPTPGAAPGEVALLPGGAQRERDRGSARRVPGANAHGGREGQRPCVAWAIARVLSGLIVVWFWVK